MIPVNIAMTTTRGSLKYSGTDTNGAEKGVLFGEVSSFQRLKCMQE